MQVSRRGFLALGGGAAAAVAVSACGISGGDGAASGAERPNLLLIMTDEERYTPPYEREAMAAFRAEHLPAHEALAARGVTLHRHYAGATACVPSRATIFTGQYPSLHGVKSTDGMAKTSDDPAMSWLDPNGVATLGDLMRAAGYQTHYRGKWHISRADLIGPNGETVVTNTADGTVLGDGVTTYEAADPLEPFGFSGWIGPEPAGSDPANVGMVRDGIFAEQVTDLFGQLAAQPADAPPWLAVASFVNPHDIGFSGQGWSSLGMAPVPDWVPDVPEAPSQSDSLDDRPACQAKFRDTWPRMVYPQPTDDTYRRLYHYLMAEVDQAVGRIVDSLEANGLAENTVIVFTSDHGDLVGAHGGLQQKWHNAYEEAIHVPMVVVGPGIAHQPEGIDMPTSHVDLVPTLLGLAGANPADIVAAVTADHPLSRPLPGRDLSGLLTGSTDAADLVEPLYFMTEDRISVGERTTSAITGAPYDAVPAPSCVESVIAEVDGSLWKLNHYYAADGSGGEQWELHDLTGDPEERVDCHTDPGAPRAQLEAILTQQRATKRLTA